MTWLIAIARNLPSTGCAPGPVRHQETMRWTSSPTTAPGAETRLIAQGEARRMADCFATLEPDRAAAVRGAYLGGLSYLDLAARFACR